MADPTPHLTVLAEDIWTTKTRSVAGGYIVRVSLVMEDRVQFQIVKRGEFSPPVEVRPATFLQRYELLHRPTTYPPPPPPVDQT